MMFTLKKLPLEKLPSLLIRIGLVFVFVYAAISSFLTPEAYLHYIPALVKQIIPGDIFLHFYEAFEITLAIWILTGKWQLVSSIIATITLSAITVFNLDSLSIVFRNVGIIFSALALVVMNLPKKTQTGIQNPIKV